MQNKEMEALSESSVDKEAVDGISYREETGGREDVRLEISENMEAENGGTEGSDMEGEHTIDEVIGELDGSFKHLLERCITLKQTPGKQTMMEVNMKERNTNKGSYTSSDAEAEAEVVSG